MGILVMSHTKIKNNKLKKENPSYHNHSLINYDISDVFTSVIEANKSYQSNYIVPQPQVPLKRVAVITCMDSRINLPALMGSSAETMFTIRNAGGRVTEDTLRSLTIAHKLLGVEQIFLIHHTDCGLQKITNEVMNNLLQESIFKAELTNNCNVTLEPLQDNNTCNWENKVICCGHSLDAKTNWLPIEQGLYASVLTDVNKIRDCKFLPSNVPIYGFIFNMATGELIPVSKAMKAGRAKPLHCKN